jgi:hypothetical protein
MLISNINVEKAEFLAIKIKEYRTNKNIVK